MKKIVIYGLVLTIVAGFSVSLSNALLTDSDGPAMNVFTSSRGIDILLREPDWDGYTFDDADWEHGLGTKNDSSDLALGYNIANEYLPGDTIFKDPQIKNAADSENSYVAMELTYYVNDAVVDYATFATYLQPGGIDFNTGVASGNWTDASNAGANDFFVYNDNLEVTEVTTTLFDEVGISYDLVPDANGYLPKLQIDVTAYAVQAKLPEATTAVDALYDFSGYTLNP